MAGLGKYQNAELSVDLLRHILLNTVRANYKKFKNEYGSDLIIACDSKYNWRKKSFSYYKASRKESRDKSDLDWNTIYEAINTIKMELKEFFPYRVIEVDYAEADDVIGTICNNFGAQLGAGTGKILILSGDKDFQQLQKYSNIYQYDPTRKKNIVCANPDFFLIDHIIRGDGSDGVPNILSDDDVFVIKKRQTVLTQKRVSDVTKKINNNNVEDFKHGYERNKTMIDLDCTPEDLQKETMEQFNLEVDKSRGKIRGYLIANRLKMLMTQISDF